MFALSNFKLNYNKKPNSSLGFLFCVLFITILSSCTQQTEHNRLIAKAKITNDATAPIGFKKTESFFDKGVSYASYEGKQNFEATLSFYKKKLEFDGFNIIDSSVVWGRKQEGMLVGSKPKKHIVVSIRSKQKSSSVHIFSQTVSQGVVDGN